jgi:hypothetical protein
MNRIAAAVTASLFLALVACGKKDGAAADAPKGGSCNHESEGTCEEYKDSALGLAEGFCKAAGGTYEKKACPTTAILGTCAKETGDKTFTYADNGLNQTAADAKAKCETALLGKAGKWTDGPEAANSKERKAPSPAKIKGSCDNRAEMDTCDDYGGGDFGDLRKSSCTDMKGTWNTTPCPAENLVGSCVTPDGRTARHYLPSKKDGFARTAADLKKDCETELLGSKGFWIAGPAADKAGAPAGAAPKGPAPKGPKGKG